MLRSSSKQKDSDYYEENNQNVKSLINNRLIDSKSVIIYNVTPNFSIFDDFKLRTTSLLLQYIKTQQEKIMLHEDYNTINTVYNDISDIMYDSLMQPITDIELGFDMNDLIETIFKNINPYLLKENSAMNLFDVSLEETLSYQLNMVAEIAKNTRDKILILFIEEVHINHLKHLLDYVKDVDNLICLIYTNGIYNKNIDDVFIMNSVNVDLCNDEDIFFGITDKLTCATDIESTKQIINELVKGVKNDKTDQLTKIIKV